jgi:AmpE protein
MTFIVSCFALLIERFFDWGHIRLWGWFYRWQQYLAKQFSRLRFYMILLLSILPVALVVGLLNFFAKDRFFGIVAIILQLLIVLLCLGPRNFWAHTFFAMNQQSTSSQSHPQNSDQLFVAAHQSVFAILFWFAILGPLGAVCYRLIELSAHFDQPSAQLDLPIQNTECLKVLAIVNWLPLRIFCFLFALSGHFVKVMTCLRKYLLKGPAYNDQLVTDCGKAALNGDQPVNMQTAVSLIDRTLIIYLVILAALVLVI